MRPLSRRSKRCAARVGRALSPALKASSKSSRAARAPLAGIWGMNFEFMPELKWKMGYPVALLLMAAIGLILYRRFRKVGWL